MPTNCSLVCTIADDRKDNAVGYHQYQEGLHLEFTDKEVRNTLQIDHPTGNG